MTGEASKRTQRLADQTSRSRRESEWNDQAIGCGQLARADQPVLSVNPIVSSLSGYARRDM